MSLRSRLTQLGTLLVLSWLTACSQLSVQQAAPVQPAPEDNGNHTPPPITGRQPFSTNWLAPLDRDHALTGRIWDVAGERFIPVSTLLERAGGVDYLLLGEKHDNPDHHRLELDILRWLTRQEQLVQLSMEMLDTSQRAPLMRYRGQANIDEPRLQEALSWQDKHWPWRFYGPIIRFALQHNIDVVPANLTADEVKEAYAGRAQPELPPLLLSEMGEALAEKQRRMVHEAHCGLLPETQLPAMVAVQQARDQRMTRSLLAAPPEGVAVLLAGAVHTRRDVGVPLWLEVYEPQADVMTLGLREVQPDRLKPAQYLDEEDGFDYLWFTPRVTDRDYCEDLKAPKKGASS